MWQLAWKKEYLDYIFAPLSLFIMFGYHLFYLYRYLKYPNSTVIGYENRNRQAWVEKMFEIDAKDRPAATVMGNNISAASTLSSITLVLSSLIGTWLGSSANGIFTSSFIYGDTSPAVISIKYVSLLICFLLAFGAFVQAARCFVHASYLLTMPNVVIPVGYIVNEVISGSNFAELGMRALYFATIFLVWAFGPIPMIFTSVVMVVVLHNLDTNTTPALQYQSSAQDLLSKVSHDISSAVTKAVAHHERPHRRID